MGVDVVDVLERVLVHGESQVALLEEEDVHVLVQEDEDPDIEFVAVDQERLLEVLLHYERGGFGLAQGREDAFQLAETLEQLHSPALVHPGGLQHPDGIAGFR